MSNNRAIGEDRSKYRRVYTIIAEISDKSWYYRRAGLHPPGQAGAGAGDIGGADPEVLQDALQVFEVLGM